MSDRHHTSEPIYQSCDHNCIPGHGGLRHLFRKGWICVRCGEWGRTLLPRLCPDCKLGPDQGEDGDCYWCRASAESQRYERAIYGADYEDGYREADQCQEA